MTVSTKRTCRDAAMAAFGVTVPPAERHTALGDVLGTVELYVAMLRSLRG